MPELQEAPPDVNPGLAALFKINIPEPEPPAPDPSGIDQPTPFPEPADKTKRPEPDPSPSPAPKPPDPEPEPKPAVADKPDPIMSRLAPDFASAAPKPAAALAATDLDLTELDKAIDGAKSEKQKGDLRKFRDQLRESHREVETLRVKLSAAPQPAQIDPETKVLLEQTTKERDELLSRVERADLMQSPRFQKEYIEPHDKVFAKAQGIVKEFGGDPNALSRALSLRGAPRGEALDELRGSITSETMRGQFDLLIRDIDDKRAVISEQLANAKQTAEEQRKQDIIEKHKNGEKSFTEMKSLLGAAQKSLLEEAGWKILEKSTDPEFDWWNKDIDAAAAASEEILFKGSAEQSVLAAVLAPQALRLHKLWQNTQAALQAANAEIAELKGSSPRISQERKAATPETSEATTAGILENLRSGNYKR